MRWALIASLLCGVAGLAYGVDVWTPGAPHLPINVLIASVIVWSVTMSFLWVTVVLGDGRLVALPLSRTWSLLATLPSWTRVPLALALVIGTASTAKLFIFLATTWGQAHGSVDGVRFMECAIGGVAAWGGMCTAGLAYALLRQGKTAPPNGLRNLFD